MKSSYHPWPVLVLALMLASLDAHAQISSPKIAPYKGALEFTYSKAMSKNSKGPITTLEITYINQKSVSSIIAQNWFLNFDKSLEEKKEGETILNAISLKDGTGEEKTYFQKAKNIYVTVSGSYSTLTKNHNGTYVRKDLSGALENYNREGRLVSMTDPNGRVTTIEYSDRALISKIKDWLGVEIVFHYEEKQLTKITSSLGDVIEIIYEPSGRLKTILENSKRTYQFRYDEQNNVNEIIYPDESKEKYEYSYTNKVIRHKDREGHITQFNRSDLETEVIFPNGALYRYRFWNEENDMEIIYPDSSKVRIKLNAWRVPYEFIDKQNQVTRVESDEFGRIKTIKKPNGAIHKFEYLKESNLVTRYEDPLGREKKLRYDGRNHIKAFIASDGTKTRIDCDRYGNIIKIIDPEGNARKFEYDNRGNIISSTDPKDQITKYEWDARCNLTEITLPNQNKIAYLYNEQDELIKETKPGERVKSYAYDVMGRIASVAYNGGKAVTFSYDKNGRNILADSSIGRQIKRIYNSMGKLLSIEESLKGEKILSKVEFSYDQLGNMTKQITLPQGKEINYTYDPSGRLTKLSSADTGDTTYSYNTNGDLISITDNSGSVVKYEYDLSGARKMMTYPNGIKASYAYTKAGRLSGIVYTNKKGVEIAKYTYDYDRLGNRTSEEVLDGSKTMYEYDPLARLSKFISPDGIATEYQYDAIGNRTAEIVNGVTTPYTYNTLGQLMKVGFHSTHYSYDGAGNTVSIASPKETIELSYNDLNRVTTALKKKGKAKVRSEYGYDAFGRRISKEIVAGDKNKSVRYLYNGFNLLAEYDSSEKLATLYITGPRIDEIISKESPGTVKLYYLRDGLNSVRLVVDAKGNIVQKVEYTPFGEIKTKVDDSNTIFGFTGREYDSETGLYFYRARYYTPDVGRFLSEDPIGLLGGMNLYAYCLNNSVNYIDPLGLYSNEEIQNEIDNVNDVIDSLYDIYVGEGKPPSEAGLQEAGNPYQGSANPMKNEFEQNNIETAHSIFDHLTSQIANVFDPNGNFWNYWAWAEIQRHERYLEWLKKQMEENNSCKET